ncbi:GNAT family N-acetyltransferase [Haloechinothrix halophila]|uniref:GNAT family N-acetyltransferase n=1 Tax=Haloechinothrix halophila TaxID=1069073 RepID=UPI00041B475E|nr:GNAT family N-acetyltransferase [Haloechinothrix halophila]
MEFVTYDDVTEFLDVAGTLYESDPVRHTIALTVLRQIAAAPSSGTRRPLLITVHDDGELIGAAFRTPPWPIGVSGVPERAMPALVEFLTDAGYEVSGVSGPRPEADRFAELWVSATGQRSTQGMLQRQYRLDSLRPPAVEGDWLRATESDVPLLVTWRRGFVEDAHMPTADPDWPEGNLRRELAAGSAHGMWRVSGVPVSYAAASVPRNGMSRVGSVYTPREYRGRGYGAAVTAAVSQWALDNGATDVVLFTDLSNPTSNAIYQKLGYVPVLDAIDHRFS